MNMIGLTVALLALAGAAQAEPFTFKDVRKGVPNGKRVEGTVIAQPFLSAKDAAILETLKDNVPFYGALAVSPDEGLFVEWLQAAGQHHSVAAAQAAALAHCNANKKAGSAACVVVLEVAPKGVKANAPLTVSQAAAAKLRREYRKLSAPKAFAISSKTGSFGFDRGDGGRALEACAAVSGAKDCRIVVAD